MDSCDIATNVHSFTLNTEKPALKSAVQIHSDLTKAHKCVRMTITTISMYYLLKNN